MARNQQKQPTPSPMAVRVRAIRETLDYLDSLPGHEPYAGIVEQPTACVKALGVPRLVVEIWHGMTIHEPDVSFALIDELASWMAEHGVSRADIEGPEEVEEEG